MNSRQKIIVVNFSHSLTTGQRRKLTTLTHPGETVTDELLGALEVRMVPCDFDNERPYEEQVRERVDAAGLTAKQWEQEALLIVPPSYAPAATTLIAELHGRMGYFPALVRVRPVADSTPRRYEIAEIINLQEVRDRARTRRFSGGRKGTER